MWSKNKLTIHTVIVHLFAILDMSATSCYSQIISEHTSYLIVCLLLLTLPAAFKHTRVVYLSWHSLFYCVITASNEAKINLIILPIGEGGLKLQQTKWACQLLHWIQHWEKMKCCHQKQEWETVGETEQVLLVLKPGSKTPIFCLTGQPLLG